jgi:hypothetical protein
MFSRRDRIMRSHLRYRLVVTTHEQATWDGVLIDADDRTLVLRDVEAVQTDGTRVPADGEVLVPRVDVAYVQSVSEMQRP